MTRYSSPPLPFLGDRRSSAPAPEHAWVSKGSTLNPSPGALLEQRRDTAEGCRDLATAFLLESVRIDGAHNRRTLEKTAAAWTARAELLQRMEARIQTRFDAADLTAGDIADGAGHSRP